MRRMIIEWLLFGAFAASAALNVYSVKSTPKAEPCAPCGMVSSMPTHPRHSLVEVVQLTPDQKQQFVSCCPSYATARTQLHKRLNILVRQLEQELFAEHSDSSRIHQLADQIGQVRAEELKSRINSILLVRKTLTPGQLKRLTDCCGKKGN